MPSVNITVDMEEEEIVEIVNDAISHDGVVEFIKMLELRYADWDISEALYEHFKKQHEIYLAEIEEDD